MNILIIEDEKNLADLIKDSKNKAVNNVKDCKSIRKR